MCGLSFIPGCHLHDLQRVDPCAPPTRNLLDEFSDTLRYARACAKVASFGIISIQVRRKRSRVNYARVDFFFFIIGEDGILKNLRNKKIKKENSLRKISNIFVFRFFEDGFLKNFWENFKDLSKIIVVKERKILWNFFRKISNIYS